ncbi:hypothetical protein PV08_06821 [Exophiala spinifera]|uniref:Uncharacterized protein n=1 Tax=Exophiala spinifera TaxID=91928 RepID=A0A0D2B5V9_9EURO|nr:uncharacterized protein PV08_06821 [Exophiala spinifera]KIW14040.1 hypothetical protein PV08_06821 [Exophiala spinifera]
MTVLLRRTLYEPVPSNPTIQGLLTPLQLKTFNDGIGPAIGTLEAVDDVLSSGKVCHGGSANRILNEKRRGLAFWFQSSCLIVEGAYPFLSNMDTIKTLSPRDQRMVALGSQFPPNSPGLWQSDHDEFANVHYWLVADIMIPTAEKL